MYGSPLASFGMSLFIIVALTLLLREFWCWYYKVNQIADLLKEINAKLGSGPGEGGSGMDEGEPLPLDLLITGGPEHTGNGHLDFCYHCGAPVGEHAVQCPSCKKQL